MEITVVCKSQSRAVQVGISESLTPTLLSSDLAEERGRKTKHGD
jgi:hypothetical protein